MCRLLDTVPRQILHVDAKRGLCDRLEGLRGSVKLDTLIWIIVGAVSSGAVVHAANEKREQDIVSRCEAVQRQNKISQLKACNPFLRTELGCLLPREGLTVDRSCVDKKLSERIYQSCIDDQGFWGHPIEPQEDNDRLLKLSSW